MIKTKRHFRTNPLRVAVFVIFCVYTVVIAVPYLWAIICSLKTRYEYNESPIFALPQHPMFVNYVKAWTELAAEDTSVLSMLFNSIWYAVGRSVLGVMFSAMAAYVVARYSFPGRRFVYGFAIVTMMLPVMGTMASGLKFARAIGTYDSVQYVQNAQLGLRRGGFYRRRGAFQNVFHHYASADNLSALRVDFVGIHNDVDGRGHAAYFLPAFANPRLRIVSVSGCGEKDVAVSDILRRAYNVYGSHARSVYNLSEKPYGYTDGRRT